ncbi:MAG TPA: Gfo/Idh/MocA family oxidoreductase [Chthoniobacteraceae bacterium]|nr:Gfo/Idh/MocA family oxidoreductase [Chthoniobacteraceae bacterium]
MSTIRFGFLGAGQIAWTSAASIHRHPSARVVAVQDLNAARVRELCEKEKIAKGYATAEELLADPEIDAVYIAVPNKFHVPLAIAALEAGKHVVLEKPFAMSYAEACQAAEVAQRTGKVLNLGMNLRFNPAAQRARALVEQNTFGEIYHAKAYWFRRRGIPKLGTWFSSRELAGGGCLYDIGVHLLDLCLYLIDNFEPVTVSGSTYTKFGNRGLGEGSWGHSERSDIAFDVEDFASGFIRFANGVSVSLDVSWAAHLPTGSASDVQLFGTEGGIHALKGEIYQQDATSGDYLVRQDRKAAARYPHGDRFHNFINHLLGKEELCVTLKQALVVQQILDGLALSSANGREVVL